MSDTQWVKHSSGLGRQFKVREEMDEGYLVFDGQWIRDLPKPDYVPCPPPERWEVVQGSEWVIEQEGHSAKLRWGHWVSHYIKAPAHMRFTTINDALVLEQRKVPQ